jgi:adenine-specific DNA-methyltransferase
VLGNQIVDLHSRTVPVQIPLNKTDDEIVRFVHDWPETLHSLNLEVSTGPVVAFRAEQHLVDEPRSREKLVPLLWLQHVQPMNVFWPIPGCTKAQYIRDSDMSRKLLVDNRTYVILRRFTAKEEQRRLTVAPLLRGQLEGDRIGLENHLNYIYQPSGEMTKFLAFGLAALLGSLLLDRWLRVSNGHTQVNAEDLRSLPLPRQQVIETLGRRVAERVIRSEEIEQIVVEVLRIPKALNEALHG